MLLYKIDEEHEIDDSCDNFSNIERSHENKDQALYGSQLDSQKPRGPHI